MFKFIKIFLSISIYHVMPMLSTTLLIIMSIFTGITLPIFYSYLGIVLFSCILLAISTISGK